MTGKGNTCRDSSKGNEMLSVEILKQGKKMHKKAVLEAKSTKECINDKN